MWMETVEWRALRGDSSVRDLLSSRMDDLEAKMKKREWPKQDMLLEICSKGKDAAVVLEEKCSRCTSWYCEIAG